MIARNSNQIFREGTVVVALAENLGSSNCQKLQAECNDLQDGLRRGTIRNIVIDCSATNCLGCAAIGLLLRLWKTTQKHDGHFAICGLSSLSIELLRVVKLNRLWPSYSSLDEAIDAVEGGNANDPSLAFA